jgi:hypothetical protein
MRYMGVKLTDGDIWQPNRGMVAVQVFGGLFRFPQGVGSAYIHRGMDGMTPEDFFDQFPDAKRVVKYKKYSGLAED